MTNFEKWNVGISILLCLLFVGAEISRPAVEMDAIMDQAGFAALGNQSQMVVKDLLSLNHGRRIVGVALPLVILVGLNILQVVVNVRQRNRILGTI